MESSRKPIHVTQPLLPPLHEFVPYLEQIWENRWLTNGGQFHQELEGTLTRRLEVPQLSLFANGTIALIVALQALRVSGEVITTPFSFVATAHSIHWNGLTPVFVDIDPESFNLDPARIEAAITPKTTAIMPVHCYGHPCNVSAIRRIAQRYGLKVIYDAAHAFDVRLGGESLMKHGDLSVLSFHATKVFTTFEGGAIASPDAATKQRIDFLKNFGIADEVTVVGPGINGKMNEIQAAFGLLQLQHLDAARTRRAAVDAFYREALAGQKGITIPATPPDTQPNYSYFPVLVDAAYPICRDELYNRMRAHGVLARRYFHPLISEMSTYRSLPSSNASNLPVATRVTRQILCLPIHAELTPEEQIRVVELIRT